MNTDGFVTEDDLILYAMQASSEQERNEVAKQLQRDPALAKRLEEIRAVLGVYASATAENHEVPQGALQRLQSRIERERVVQPEVPSPASHAAKRPEKDSRRGWSLPWMWSGWAVAAVLLVWLGLLVRQIRTIPGQPEAKSGGTQDAQAQVASVTAERDQLRASVQEKSAALNAERQRTEDALKRAEDARSRSADLNAKVAQSDLQAARAMAQVNALTATVDVNEAERRKLGEALTREQQLAASAAESQRVLAALSDPSALHVTLTVPKEQKRPSGRGTYLASTGALVFTGSNLASLPEDKVYELWLLPTDGSAPIAAGTFRPDASGNATLITNRFQQRVSAAGFAITIEKAGGASTPTMPIVLVGTA